MKKRTKISLASIFFVFSCLFFALSLHMYRWSSKHMEKAANEICSQYEQLNKEQEILFHFLQNKDSLLNDAYVKGFYAKTKLISKLSK